MKQVQIKSQPNNNDGDTIVEVLVVIAIVAAMLVGAFIVANRSTGDVRDSEEHTEALQYLQAQAELLRTAATTHNGLPPTGVHFCMGSSQFYINSSGTYNVNCTFGGQYDIDIVASSVSNTGTYLFELQAMWSNTRGSSNAVRISYRTSAVP